MTALRNAEVLIKLEKEISAAQEHYLGVEHLVEARDEIMRQNVLLAAARNQIKQLCRWLSEQTGDPVEIIRKIKD